MALLPNHHTMKKSDSIQSLRIKAYNDRALYMNGLISKKDLERNTQEYRLAKGILFNSFLSDYARSEITTLETKAQVNEYRNIYLPINSSFMRI